ncbi:MAG: peptide chain release factor 2 [Candidatus Omnitrophica bacterium]|nr:peptide chain release factor 2 [Candidatus Omnitrophota bacterium]
MLEEIKEKLSILDHRLRQLRVIFDIDHKKEQIEELNRLMSGPGFWEDTQNSTRVVKQLKELKSSVEPWELAFKKYQEFLEFAELLKPEDTQLAANLMRDLENVSAELEKLEFNTLFSGEFDRNSAILSINAGAGGTESCDWVSMLLRMYSRFSERHGYSTSTIDILAGEEAGIKNVTILVEGGYAYGYLKAERGVHRLVRISPFDANKRRHTSFASVDVIPEIEDDVEVKIEDKDLAIETFRASGPGGQHMQKTDSAVRITHLPSGITVQSQNERSQHQNKQTALKILKARIYELEREKKEEQLLKTYDAQKKRIEFGSQIRSYVMHPYNLVKDHRTDCQTGDVNKVMDGGIDEFIEEYLKKQKLKGKSENHKDA